MTLSCFYFFNIWTSENECYKFYYRDSLSNRFGVLMMDRMENSYVHLYHSFNLTRQLLSIIISLKGHT